MLTEIIKRMEIDTWFPPGQNSLCVKKNLHCTIPFKLSCTDLQAVTSSIWQFTLGKRKRLSTLYMPVTTLYTSIRSSLHLRSSREQSNLSLELIYFNHFKIALRISLILAIDISWSLLVLLIACMSSFLLALYCSKALSDFNFLNLT